ncbi:ribonuclease H-like domain-containing protein [Tanacetum coccineum]
MTVETPTKNALIAQDGLRGYDWSHEANELKIYDWNQQVTVKMSNSSPPVSEEFNSDEENEVELITNVKDKTVRPSTKEIKFVKETVERVNAVRDKDTTARQRAVVNEGRGSNADKASTCWGWKAKNSSSSNTFKKYTYIDARGRSKHMIGNKCYLTEYEGYKGGFVSFGDGKGKITGKGIENQLDHKVKVIRSDNGTEFKNSVMNQFCESKGIKREFNVARTPQQNGVAERKNRTLIEAARPIPPLIDFMKPFGCPITILNTRDYLGKFEGKADEGFFVGYSVVSKAIRVFNKRIRIIEETLNISFLENIPNVKGNGPDWIFDVDSLSISMNYVPVMVENQTNAIVRVKHNIIACQVEKKKEVEQEYILIPFCTTDPFISKGPKESEVDAGEEHTKEGTSEASDDCGQDNQVTRNDFESEFERLLQQEKQDGSTVNTANSHVNDIDQEVTAVDENIVIGCSHDPNIPELEDTGIFDGAYDDEVFAAERGYE